MPKVKIINGVEIKIHRNDHNPPHVHVDGPDFDLSIQISTFEILAGKNTHKAKKAIAWIKENQSILMIKWNQYNG